ncbi:hypothetical protein PVAG01_03996 [Phlyctema vagabunda]|uniref:Apple domain-containing protein n=1 Tax=Phlyctema vagabunda TaxID=108571 RepID=A0ABR4PN45_9HELO
MQYLNLISAVALLSDSALAAVPQLLEKQADVGFTWPWAEKRDHDYDNPPVVATPSNHPLLLATAPSVYTSLAAYYPTAPSAWATGTAASGLSPSSAYTCPNFTASTSYVTVTASVTSTSIYMFTGTGSGLSTASSANNTGIYTHPSWNSTSSTWAAGTGTGVGTGTSKPAAVYSTITQNATTVPCTETRVATLTTLINGTASTVIQTLHTNTTTTLLSTHTRSGYNYSTTASALSSSTVTPVIINTGSDLHPTTSFTPTTTVTSDHAATGTPDPLALHCGLHGLPVGDYFLAEFVENRDDEAVTLQGCYQFCKGVYGISMGCESYSFYPEPGTDAPRCDLYGGSVAQSLDSINNYVPNVWYDLACGDPTTI